MNTDTTHTPLPWNSYGCAIYAGHRTNYGKAPRGAARLATTAPEDNDEMPDGERLENAEFICRAVNCHDELLAALEAIEKHAALWLNFSASHDGLKNCDALAKARAAIAKATQPTPAQPAP
jgi:hypothetical protein